MRVLFGIHNDGADAYFRAAAPGSVLRYQSYPVKVKVPVLGQDADKFDLLILQRHATSVGELVMREFQERGKPVIYDTDDWLHGLPPSWPCYGDYFNRGSGRAKPALEYHQRMLEMADLVTCPTEALADKIATYNGTVRVLPNCVMMGEWDTVLPVRAELDGPVLGWFGSFNHWDTWRAIAGAVDEALAWLGNAYLAVLGFPEVVRAFPKRLAARTLVQPMVKFRDFHRMRRLIAAFDVGLAWLEDDEFNRCKSPLKALQYGAAGVPVVASQAIYGDVMTPEFGTLAKNVEELPAAICWALGDLEASREKATRWQQEVWQRHSYETQSWLWLDVIEEVLLC